MRVSRVGGGSWGGKGQVGGDRGQHRGFCGMRIGKESGCILRAEPTGFSDRLDIRVKGTANKDEAIIFALYVLSSWREGSAIKRFRDSQVSAQENRPQG